MLNMMTIEPESNDNEMENYKYANTICEILTHDGNVFSNLIATNRKYLLILWSFLDESCRNEIPVESEPQQQQSTETESTIVEKIESNEKNDDDGDKNDTEGEIKNEKEIVKETHTNDDDDDKKFESKQQTKPMTNERSLNPLLASFFTKVFSYMFMHDMESVLEFLFTRNHPNDLVTVLLKHIQASAIMDLIYKTWKYVNVDQYNQINQLSSTNEMEETSMIKNDEQPQQQQESQMNLKFNDLLIENEFVDKLIDMFENPELESEQQNVAQLISDMIRLKREVLINAKPSQQEVMTKFDLESENMVTQQEAQLSSMITASKKSTDPMNDKNTNDNDDDELETMPKFLKQQNSLNVSRLMERMVEKVMDFPQEETQNEHLTQCVRNSSKVLNERLEDFVNILIESPYCESMKTTAGIIEKPLGFIRLEVIHLFVALFATSDFQIMKKCSQLNVLKILTVKTIPVKSFETKNDEDGENQCVDKVDEKSESNDVQKLENADDIIMEEQQQSEAKKPMTDEETSTASKKPKLISRPGYMGHLRLIANTLKERCNEDLLRECSLEELLPQWKEFIEGKLEKLNQLITAELVPESKRNPLNEPTLNEESEFFGYKKEDFKMTNIISEPKPLPDFSNQNLDINETLKLNNNMIINDFEKFWDNPNEDFESLEKYFECSTKSQEINKKLANPDDIDDPWANEDSFNATNEKQPAATDAEQWPKRSEFLAQESFVSFNSNEMNQKVSDEISLRKFFLIILE
ncbi:serine/threonine-protein phosphatase 6 regulatory subunit 3-like [Euroglyphus maynei]|uniref:Serine/threonine-protein phosphatase 6 regulatory subunit 3-like n=1 Tax=Euroglyphus maynei TaxID=6958 RepID=A0A1Y3B6L8_EURMA|nr:serine/threonine-protein phosphatase 6 regulatory subunit 3-like [Euroglyphus maynei]